MGDEANREQADSTPLCEESTHPQVERTSASSSVDGGDTPRARTDVLPAEDQAQAFVSQYATLYAHQWLIQWRSKPSRIREAVDVRGGTCQRRIRVDVRLPALADVGLSPDQESGEWVIPIWPMRRGQLLTDFEVVVEGHRCRIASRRRSVEYTRELLGLEWEKLRTEIQDIPIDLDAYMQEKIRETCSEDSQTARAAVVSSYKRLIEYVAPDSEALKGYFASAKFLSRRYIQWIASSAQPGETVTIRYVYETRYAPEYVGAPDGSALDLNRHLGTLRRWIGQAPAYLIIPVSRLYLSRSYHVTFTAPDGCYLRVFQFVDQGRSGTVAETFDTRTGAAGINVTGADEAGGQVGHLYTYDYTSSGTLGVAVRARIAERPPGGVSRVAWLTLVTALFVGFLMLAPGVLLGQNRWLFLAAFAIFPAFLSVWAGPSLQTDVLARASLATRLSAFAVWPVTLTLVATAIWFGNGGEEDGPNLPWMVSTVLWAAAALMAFCSFWLWTERFRTYRDYRTLQRNVSKKYGM